MSRDPSKPIHLFDFAPQDWRDSKVRTRSIRKNDPMLRLVYLELLFSLMVAGGKLPYDLDTLEDDLGVDAEELERCLPILARLGKSGRGGITIEDGVVMNRRICDEIAAFRDRIEVRRKGGLASVQARRERSGTAQPNRTSVRGQSNKCSGGSEHVFDASRTDLELSPRARGPLPLPLPLPLPGKAGVVASTKQREARVGQEGGDVPSPVSPSGKPEDQMLDFEDEGTMPPAEAVTKADRDRAKTAKRDQEVWDAYHASLPEGQKRRTFTPAARKAIARARKAGYTQEQILAAAQGWTLDKWQGRVEQNHLDIVLRLGERGSRANLDTFAALWQARGEAKAPPGGGNNASTTKLLLADSLREARMEDRWHGDVDQALRELEALPLDNAVIAEWAAVKFGEG